MGKKINYEYNSLKESPEQYHARIANERGESSGELNGAGGTPADATERIGKFGAALNVAVDQARQQRKDKTLDFLGGVVPKGALPASSFAQVLKSFNSDSAPLESTLLNSAMDFAKDAEKRKEDTKNSIRDLALAVGENGGKQETVNAITALIESGDIDSALKIGATALSKGNEDIRQVGSNLVKVDKDGNVSVIYSAPDSDGGGKDIFISGGLEISKEDIAIGETALENSRGEDGHANTDLYVRMYKKWIDENGDPQDFYKEYPPDYYLNPKDPTVELQIKSMMKAPPKTKEETTAKKPPEPGSAGYDEYLLTGKY